MSQKTWVIIGATSIIAEQFAHLAAAAGHHLRLVGRDNEQLNIIAQDIKIRYQVTCEFVLMDMARPDEYLLTCLAPCELEMNLFIAHSDFTKNAYLSPQTINRLVNVNILATLQLIHAYLGIPQKQHTLLYLSSVAACRGRAVNSLYGASKRAIEVYLQGLQQATTRQKRIIIARLGFIDTKQTYGLPGIFYAAQPEDCAEFCWRAINQNKSMVYFPGFWRAIMALITRLPTFVYKYVR